MASSRNKSRRSRSEKIMIAVGVIIVFSMLAAPLVTILIYREPVTPTPSSIVPAIGLTPNP